MQKVEIKPLCENKSLIPKIAHWIWQEFWADKPDFSANYFEKRLHNEFLNNTQIPLGFVAFMNTSPCGSVLLIENDDEKRTHLRPWLAALFVLPESRNQGVGRALVQSVLLHAKKLNERQIFLGTDNPRYYLNLGAEVHEQVSESFAIMRFDI